VALTPWSLTWRQRWTLLCGKLRRLGLGLFGRRYIRRRAAARAGECLRCGACCRLAYRCHLLRDNGQITECRFHGWRPLNCRLFPIDERDLADRDLIAPDTACGFRFGPEGDRTGEPSPTEAMPDRDATGRTPDR